MSAWRWRPGPNIPEPLSRGICMIGGGGSFSGPIRRAVVVQALPGRYHVRRTTTRDGALLLVQVASSREARHISWAQELNFHAIPVESITEEPPAGVHCI